MESENLCVFSVKSSVEVTCFLDSIHMNIVFFKSFAKHSVLLKYNVDIITMYYFVSNMIIDKLRKLSGKPINNDSLSNHCKFFFNFITCLGIIYNNNKLKIIN